MPLYIGSIVVKVADLPRAVAFWAAVLGYVVRGRGDAIVDPGTDFVVLTERLRALLGARSRVQPVPSPRCPQRR
jgi:hypothetical protein